MLEVYDFVYGYLLRQTKPGGFTEYAQWLVDEWGYPYDTIEDRWDLLVRCLRLMLSPADIIELLLFTSQWKHAPTQQLEWLSTEKESYLRLRGYRTLHSRLQS
jgi:hypothetical protein